jgi:hypothetical protein
LSSIIFIPLLQDETSIKAFEMNAVDYLLNHSMIGSEVALTAQEKDLPPGIKPFSQDS